MSDLANVLWRHLRRDRNALFIWGGICGGMALLMAVMYPSLSHGFEQVMKVYPEVFLQAFMGRSLPSLTAVEGFMAIELFSWVPVMFAAFAALAGAGMIAEETDRGTVEFLLAQPVRRRTVVVGKFLVFLIYLLGIVGVSALGLALGLAGAGVDHDPGVFLHMWILNYLAAAAYGAIALLVSSLAGELRRATSLSLGIMFGTWFIILVANLYEKVEFLGYLSPFQYASAGKVLERGALDPVDAGILLAVTAVFFAAAVAHFDRKDLAG